MIAGRVILCSTVFLSEFEKYSCRCMFEFGMRMLDSVGCGDQGQSKALSHATNKQLSVSKQLVGIDSINKGPIVASLVKSGSDYYHSKCYAW